jgi:hypothetical protein
MWKRAAATEAAAAAAQARGGDAEQRLAASEVAWLTDAASRAAELERKVIQRCKSCES